MAKKTLRELAETRLNEIEISKTSVFSSEDVVSKVLGVFKDTNRTEVVAASRDKYGIITVRDLLEVDHVATTKIETVWKPVGALRPAITVLEAVDFMIQNNVTAVPVVSKDEVSLLSQEDISTALMEVAEMTSMRAKEIMRHPVVSVDKETPIAQVRRIMLDKGISHIPITQDGKLEGIITGEEIVTTFITDIDKTTWGERSGKKVPRFPGQVGGFMTRTPVTAGPEESVLKVIKKMLQRGKKYCLIVDEEDRLHGIITHRELLDIIHSLIPEPELPVYIVGIDDEDFFEKSVVEEKIRRTVQRTLKMEEITEVSIMVKKQRKEGNRTRYSVTARAMGPLVSYEVKNEGWGLMETFDGIVEALDKTLLRAKKDPPKGARRGRRTPNPHLKP